MKSTCSSQSSPRNRHKNRAFHIKSRLKLTESSVNAHCQPTGAWGPLVYVHCNYGSDAGAAAVASVGRYSAQIQLK